MPPVPPDVYRAKAVELVIERLANEHSCSVDDIEGLDEWHDIVSLVALGLQAQDTKPQVT